MSTRKIKLSTVLLCLVTGCISPVPTPSPSVSSTPETVSLPRPTPTPMPTLAPSDLPSPIASVYGPCVERNLLEASQVLSLNDVAVSPDGKKVYVPQDYAVVVIEQGKPVQGLALRDMPWPCWFTGSQIETDSKGNLYLLQSTGTVNLDVETVRVLKIQSDLRLLTHYYKDYGPRTPMPFYHPDLGHPTKLYVDQADSVYLFFDTHNVEYPSYFYRLQPPDQMTPIFSGFPTLAFDASTQNIYIGGVTFETPPYPKNITFAKRILSKEDEKFLGGGVTDMKVDVQGNIIASVQENSAVQDAPLTSSIWKIFPTEKRAVKLAGGNAAGFKDGKGESAAFNRPQAIALDAQGNIYVADTGNQAIRKVTPQGEVTTLFRNP